QRRIAGQTKHVLQFTGLLWQSGVPQRSAKSLGERWRTVHASKLAAVAKGRVKLEHTGGGRPRFIQSAKFGQRGGQLHISDAVCRIGLNGLVSRTTSFFVTPAQQMAHRLRVKRGPGPRIERAQPHALLAPFYRALGFAAPSENDA